MKDTISEMTRDVGPVRPLSAGECTLRPHPRWSKECVWIPEEASVGKSS